MDDETFGAPTGLVLDMTKADENGFDLLDPGTYPAHVFEIEVKTSNGVKTKGAKMLKVTYKLAGGKGRVWDNLILTPDFAWKFKQLALAAGIDKTELSGQIDVAALIPQIKGQQVALDLAVEPGNDQYPAKNVVRKVQPLPEAVATAPAGAVFAGIDWSHAN